MKLKQIMVIVLAVLVLIILLQNTAQVTFRFLFWKITMSQFFYIPLLVGLGFILGYFTAVMSGRPKKKQPDEHKPDEPEADK